MAPTKVQGSDKNSPKKEKKKKNTDPESRCCLHAVLIRLINIQAGSVIYTGRLRCDIQAGSVIYTGRLRCDIYRQAPLPGTGLRS